MTRVIAIVSGKGGVGKTTFTANLGVALAKMGKRVVMIDADMQMANLGLALGMEGRPITLQDVLIGEASIHDALYDVHAGARLMPSGLSLDKFRRVDEEKLGAVVAELSKGMDFILLDAPAGVGPNTLSTMHAATEALIITMPEPSSVTDALKTALIAERRMNLAVIGFVIEMAKGLPQEMKADEIKKILQVNLLGIVPEDPKYRMAALEGVPVVIKAPDAPSSQAIYHVASQIAGVAYAAPKSTEKKPGLFDFITKMFAPKKPSVVQTAAAIKV